MPSPRSGRQRYARLWRAFHKAIRSTREACLPSAVACSAARPSVNRVFPGLTPQALCLRALRALSEVNQVPECEFRTPSFTSINWRSTPGIVYPAHSHAQSKRKSRLEVIHEETHQSANRSLPGRPTNGQLAQSMVSECPIIKAAGAANSVFAATRFGNQKSSAGCVGE